MTSHQKKIWFPAKRYGWGWGPPCTWQGWLWMLAYIAVTGIAAIFLARENQMGVFFAVEIVCTAVFLAVVWLKGEKPRWRWGDD